MLNFAPKGSGVSEVAALVGPMLGPYGMDHMVIGEGGEILLSKDGTTILQHLPLLQPYARLLLTLAKAQSQSVGDGSISAVLLACSLFQSAEILVHKGVHPAVIVEEYNSLLKKSQEILQNIAIPLTLPLLRDNPSSLLMHIAKTSISAKVLGEYADHFAKLAIIAIQSLNTPAFYKIHIRTRAGGTMKQSQLLSNTAVFSVRNHAFALLSLLPSSHPIRQSKQSSLNSGRIFVSNSNLNGSLVSSNIGSSIKVSGYIHAFENAEAERSRLTEVCNNIISLGVHVVVALSPVSPITERYLIENGVLLVTVSALDELEQIAVCSSCSVDFSDLLSKEPKVGTFTGLNIAAANDSSPLDVLYISGNSGEICTVQLNAPTVGLAEECCRCFSSMVRVLLNLVEEPAVIGGGGSAALELCVRLSQNSAPTTQAPYADVCRQAYCEGLLVIPFMLAINSGLEAVRVVEMARQAHWGDVIHTKNEGDSSGSAKWQSVNLDTGNVADMLELGVVEPLRVFRQGLTSAVAVVELMLRTDKSVVLPPKPEIQ